MGRKGAIMKLSFRTRTILAAAVLVAAQCVVFSPALKNEFLKYDDDVYVYDNHNIQSLKPENIAWMFARPYYRSYTPFALLSHAVDYSVWGNNPFGHHLTNLLLHSVNAILVFLLGLMVLRMFHTASGPGAATSLFDGDGWRLWGALVGALLFSLHPMRVESVAWVSDRKDLLLTLFFLLSCIAYIKYDQVRGTSRALRWFLLSLLWYVLALLSKSIAITTPAVFLLLDVLLLQRESWRANRKPLLTEKTPFFLLSIAFGVLAIVAAKGSHLSDIVAGLSQMQTILLPLYSIAFYPVKMLWPADLTPVYDASGVPLMLLANLMTLGITMFAIRMARNGKAHWLLAWSTYIILIMPTLTGLSAGIQPWADRYSYLPSVSLAILVGGGVAALGEHRARKGAGTRALATLGVMAVVFICGYLSWNQLPIWRNGEALWRYSSNVTPELPMPYANLGVALEGTSDHDGALAMYSKAIAIQPRYADALYNMGITYEAKQMVDSAAALYGRALAADRSYTDAYVNLGNIMVRDGRYDDAIRLYEQATKLDPSDPDAYYDMGIAVYHKGDKERALKCFETAIKFSPGYANAYNNMGVVFVDLGNEQAAIASFVRAARLGSQDAQHLLKSKGYTW